MSSTSFQYGDSDVPSDEDYETNPDMKNPFAKKHTAVQTFRFSDDESETAKGIFHSLQDEAQSLIHSESLDKESALGIMKLMHDMERITLKLVHEKDKQVDNLKREINVMQVKESSVSKVQNLTRDISEISQRLAAIEERLSRECESSKGICKKKHVRRNFFIHSRHSR